MDGVARSGYPSGTVTFLFTDIEGSTNLWERYPAVMPAAYARHDAFLREACTAHGGIVYKTIGDAIQAAFPSAPDAVAAALSAQAAIQREEWPTPQPIRVRMALHTGAATPDPDGDYRSPVLNRLGRLLGAGHGGQVLLSQATMELARDHLPAGAALRDLGEQRLKDLHRPERVYQLAGSGLTDAFPVLRTLDARPNNLPVQPTPFIGREQAVTEVRALLEQPGVRLLTLTGPGGMGKTRLGLQVATDVLERFGDGVWFVELAALTDPALVPSVIANTLSVQDAGDYSLPARLGEHLQNKHLLLVLDNFEQVADAAPQVGELLAGCPRLAVLVTSRTRLKLRGEHEFPVSPLTLPDPRRLPSFDRLAQYESVRLFVARAVEARPGFAVTNENAQAVAEICVRLDGLPLAIELAAARIRMLPPEAMLRRLESRLPLLTGGAWNLPDRQRTLRGAIAWSYELLSPNEQALFRRMSVFAGGSTLEAIEAVAAGDELEFDIFDGLERLVDQSLLRQTETAGEPRFVMLETIREYGLQQLETSREDEEAHQRHTAHFVDLAVKAEPELTGSEQRHWLDRLETELDNFRMVLGWTLEHDPRTALRLAAILWWFWHVRGPLGEGRRWLEQALACGNAAPADIRAQVLNGAGVLAYRQGDLPRSVDHFEESLELARELRDQAGISRSLNNLGNVAFHQGDLPRAESLFAESLTLARETGDVYKITGTLNNLGNVAYGQRNLPRAVVLYEESLALARGMGDQANIANALTNLGNVALAQDDLPRAGAFYDESLAVAKDVGDQAGIATLLTSLGVVAYSQGDLIRAVACLREGILLSLDLGSTPLLAAGMEGVTRIAAAADPMEATRLAGVAAAQRASVGEPLEAPAQARHASVLDMLRRTLGDARFGAAWEEGQELPMEDAVVLALVTALKAAGMDEDPG